MSRRTYLTKDELAEIAVIENERADIAERKRELRKAFNDILFRGTMRMRRANKSVD